MQSDLEELRTAVVAVEAFFQIAPKHGAVSRSLP
jgi:hypothetical protein